MITSQNLAGGKWAIDFADKTPQSQSDMSKQNQSDYQLLDSGNFEKLELVGPFLIRRPSPSAVWKPRLPDAAWNLCDAKFDRFSDGDGKWTLQNDGLKNPWQIHYHGLQLQLKLTGFGHLGLFAEQGNNWQQLENATKKCLARTQSAKALNLFAYTGGSSLACAKGGGEVAHVDASKTSVNWAKTNSEFSGLKEAKIRWLVDDASEFVDREIRRGSKYHGIILDPPSYGRGNKNQIWDIEKHLGELMDKLVQLLDPQFSFVLLSAHSPGYTPISLENQLKNHFHKSQFGPLSNIAKKFRFVSYEMVVDEIAGEHLPAKIKKFVKNDENLISRKLPSGACCWMVRIEDSLN
jgi:23S rRNA (cytosine1962-C5)-methyltransferase